MSNKPTRQLLLMCIFALVILCPMSAQAADESAESIGTKAGTAYKQLKATTGETTQTLSEEKDKTQEKLEKVGQEVMAVLTEQFEKAKKKIEEVTVSLLEAIGRETQKFQEAANVPDPQSTAP